MKQYSAIVAAEALCREAEHITTLAASNCGFASLCPTAVKSKADAMQKRLDTNSDLMLSDAGNFGLSVENGTTLNASGLLARGMEAVHSLQRKGAEVQTILRVVKAFSVKKTQRKEGDLSLCGLGR